MGYSACFIAIKGNHIEEANEVFEAFGYVDLYRDKTFSNWDKTASFISKDGTTLAKKGILLRPVWFIKDWTLFFDQDMTDIIKDEAFEAISKKFNSIVFTFLFQTTSGSYSFTK